MLVGLRSIEPAARLPWRLLVAALIIINVATLIGNSGTSARTQDISLLLDGLGNAIVLAAALVLVDSTRSQRS